MLKWCHNAKTGEIFSYCTFFDGTTDFPRGDLILYGDYLTVGFASKEKAVAWGKEWGACPKCRGAKKPNETGCCSFCSTKISFNKGE